MKKIIFLLLCTFLIVEMKAQSIIGAWETFLNSEDGEQIKNVVIFSEGYQVSTWFDAKTGEFISTNGGTWKLDGDTMIEKVEFDTKNPARVGSEVNFKIDLKENTLGIVGNEMKWSRIDNGVPGKLQGAWLMSGRIRDGKTQKRDTNRPRKTMKILSGTRFQWVAYNTATKQFMGTGGGTYTTINGKYTENIGFFSRDDSRVGASLVFDYELIDGKWHHSGLSSKGAPIHEIWSVRKPNFSIALKGINKKAIESSKHWLDVDYVGDGHIGHRMDIHLPKMEQAFYPVVICVYGSAWFSNSSKAATFSGGVGQALLDNGFAVVSINHRSSKDALFPAQIQDVKAAIRFVRANAAAFSLDSSFVGITGWSSGGHLAAFAGTSSHTKIHRLNGEHIDLEGDLGAFPETSSHVDAVVDWFGPTDFLIMDKCGSSFSHDEAKSPESSLVGGAIQENPNKCALANPITYVQKNNPPFLIFHGNQDPLVPHCQSEKLYEKLQKATVESELVIIEGGKHGPGVMIDGYYDKMIAFFRDKLK